MTVAELIEQLKLFPQDLDVQMSMEMEYQEAVQPHYLCVYTGRYTDKPFLMIDNSRRV
jgi:hypothetical protein